MDSHHSLLLLLPGSSFEHGPLDLTAKLLPMHDASLPNHLSVFQSIGDRLSPVHFRGPQSRLVSCYAFFKGWLLLSPPPSCFRLPTPFVVTLSRYLGTLTSGWVAFPCGPQAYPRGPHSQRLRRPHVRSLTGCRRISPPKRPISALPHGLPRLRSSCD